MNRQPPLIESKDNLAHVFNNYMLNLHTQQVFYAPRFESMRSLQFMLRSDDAALIKYLKVHGTGCIPWAAS